MKTRKRRGPSALTRITVASALFMLSGVHSLWAGAGHWNQDVEPVRDEVSSLEDEQNQETPILELDPERKYRSEALLSYKSSLAPYGKVIGIRIGDSGSFTSVSTWKDVEDFVLATSDNRVTVKLLEPWGSELVVEVTINRKAYPASRIRPSEPPVTAPKPETVKPEAPKTAPEPKTEPVVLTNIPRLTTRNPEPQPTTSKPGAIRSDEVETRASNLEARLIEPAAASATLAHASVQHLSPTVRPTGTKATVAMGPNAVSSSPRLIEPGTKLATSHEGSKATAAKPAVARTDPATAAIDASARLIEPKVAQVLDPYELALLSSSPFGPARRAPVQNRVSSPAVVASIAPIAVTARGLSRAAKSPVAKGPIDKGPDDDAQWLREAIDLADRLGILTCKPVVTSDRRQRAFALYTLYMGLKDFKLEVHLRAERVNRALAKLEARPNSETALEAVVSEGRSYERALRAIQQWDADTMKSVVSGYAAELQTMDEVRSMTAFLSKVKEQPKLSSDLRSISGLENEEE